jgi:hypothetical protein
MRNLRLEIFLFFLLVGTAFSPLVIPNNETGPWLFGMPRTLWMGIGISLALLVVVLISALKKD